MSASVGIVQERTFRPVNVEEISRAEVAGHLEAILSRKDELLSFAPDDLERLSMILDATRHAKNECCTGG